MSVCRLFGKCKVRQTALVLSRFATPARLQNGVGDQHVPPYFRQALLARSPFLLHSSLRYSSSDTQSKTVPSPQEVPPDTNIVPGNVQPSGNLEKDLPVGTVNTTAVTDSPEPAIESLPQIGPIPEPPVAPVEVNEIIELVGGEPPFSSLGLGGWSPVGIVQNCLEYLHISQSIPWWGTIAIGTVVVRLMMFPLVIMAQRNAAKMNNHMPQMQVLQLKMSDARERGDRLEAARYAQEMVMFMKEKQLNPLKNMIVPLAQAPLFISFFMGLREMANLPVASMREGGLFWFVDLTTPDQYCILPLITSATLALTIEVGTDAGKLHNLGVMKYVLRGLPIVIFPFTLNFSNGILVYWVSTNFISLLQVSFLKIPAVREYFKIDKLVSHDKNSLPIKDKGFVKGMSESWTNMKLTRELEERERVDQVNFMRAGRGAVRKTYKYDPTVVKPTIVAKKRDS